MLTIRLQRTGAKNKASFRLVLAQSYRAAGKQALEVLGHYNPRSKEFGIRNKERLNHWLDKHVSVSPTVYNLLVEKKLVEGKKVKAWQPKKKQANAEAKTPETLKAAVPSDGGSSPALKEREEAASKPEEPKVEPQV